MAGRWFLCTQTFRVLTLEFIYTNFRNLSIEKRIWKINYIFWNKLFAGRAGFPFSRRQQQQQQQQLFFFSFFFFSSSFFEEQRAPRERAPSSELRLEGKGVKRTRETIVPFAKLKKKFQARRLENVLLHHIHVDEMKKVELLVCSNMMIKRR